MKKRGFALILACLLAALLCQPAGAVRTVPVTVDGVLLSGSSYVSGGVTMAPLRALCAALGGGWSVSWNTASRCAVASCQDAAVTAVPGSCSLAVNGSSCTGTAAVAVRDGCTYVPLRTLCEALGYAVSWDSALGGAAVSTGRASAVSYSSEDLYWLSRIISAESQGEPLNGQIAVGNVVLNRVASSEFPNTIRGVIFDTRDGVQFEPVSNGTVYDEPTALSVAAAKAALSGTSVVGSCLYFFSPALSKGQWIVSHRTYCTTIGCHRFYL